MTRWTWAAASRRGTSHEQTDSERQDAFRCVVGGVADGVLIAVACDGAGSASHGGMGAMLASRTLSQRAKLASIAQDALPDDESLLGWIDEARDQIAVLAQRQGLTMRDFATTLIMAISTGRETVAVHIGDGSAVGRSSESQTWESLSWPEHGEYASTTFFLTDEGLPRVRIARRGTAIDRLALFTDGIERLALDFAQNRPHEPFFAAISEPVARSPVAGCDVALSGKLGAYLSSDAINARTDDDKTLIVASAR